MIREDRKLHNSYFLQQIEIKFWFSLCGTSFTDTLCSNKFQMWCVFIQSQTCSRLQFCAMNWSGDGFLWKMFQLMSSVKSCHTHTRWQHNRWFHFCRILMNEQCKCNILLMETHSLGGKWQLYKAQDCYTRDWDSCPHSHHQFKTINTWSNINIWTKKVVKYANALHCNYSSAFTECIHEFLYLSLLWK